MFPFYLGILLSIVGLFVSVFFPVSRIRSRLKAHLGPKYRLVYLVYLANGPVLLLFGLLLLYLFRP